MVRIEEKTFTADCAWREVIDLIGDKWSVMILHTICNSRLRYSEIHRYMPGISQKVLTATLRQLERNGIVKRTVHPVVPPKVEYELTPLGKNVFEVVESLRTWAIAHLDEIEGARKTYDARKIA